MILVGFKFRKYCPFHILKAMLVFALSELFKAKLQRQVGIPITAGTATDGPHYRKTCIRA